MLATELIEYLKTLPKHSNVLVYVPRFNETRQLLMSDIDRNKDGNVVIDADYQPPVKVTTINPGSAVK